MEGERKVILPENTFQDCVEGALRHFVNIFFYNPGNEKFDIPEHISNDELRAFYDLQAPSHVYGPSWDARDQWAKVVSHIPGVHYNQEGNEIVGTPENFIKVLRHILKFRVEEKIPDSRQDIAEEFKALILYMNPRLESENINIIVDLQYNMGAPIYHIKFEVKNEKDQVFSFELFLSRHAQISNITLNGISIIKGKSNMIYNNGTSTISFLGFFTLIHGKNNSNEENFYGLFANGMISDDNARLNVIKHIIDQKEWSKLYNFVIREFKIRSSGALISRIFDHIDPDRLDSILGDLSENHFQVLVKRLSVLN